MLDEREKGRGVAETHIGDQARRGVPCGGAPLGSGNLVSGPWVRLIERLFVQP